MRRQLRHRFTFSQLQIARQRMGNIIMIIQQLIFKLRRVVLLLRINGVIEDVNVKDVWSGKTNLGKDRGGLSISIIGDDGVRYYGSHLSKIETGIAPGVVVTAGQKLGEVGSSGSARGTKPHLHFGISYPTKPGDWEIRRGVIYPWKYLDAWKAGKDLSPAKAIETARVKAGK